MSIRSFDKLAFVLSVAVLSFLYGIATHAFAWFPSGLIQRAWNQAEAISPISTARLTTNSNTGPTWTAPRVYQRAGAREIRPNRSQEGLTLISTVWPSDGWEVGLKLINKSGSTVHYWPINPKYLFPDSLTGPGIGRRKIRYVQGSYLFPNGELLVNVESRGTARLDACGNAIWRLPAGNHHSIARSEDSTFWSPVRRYESPPTSRLHPDGYKGLQQSTFHDRLLHFTADGQVLDNISVLDLLYENDLEHIIAKMRRHDSDDVTHLNDVEPLNSALADRYPAFQAGDLLVSLRNLNLVFVVDPDTHVIEWYATDPFIQQHDPDFMANGWIGVFDNNRDGTARGTMLGGSRIVALKPNTDSTKVLYPTSISESFYTEIGGKWQKLRSGNLLLTEMYAGRIVEVTPEGRTVWDWVAEPHSESRVPEVFGGTRYYLTEEKVASWPCSPSDSTDPKRQPVR